MRTQSIIIINTVPCSGKTFNPSLFAKSVLHGCLLVTGRVQFLGAATGSPYIVFILRFCCMASCYGNIYIYIYNT